MKLRKFGTSYTRKQTDDLLDLKENKVLKIQEDRDPETSDLDYPLYTLWINTETNNVFKLLKITEGDPDEATWIKTSLTIEELGSMSLENSEDYYNKTEVNEEFVDLSTQQTIEGNKTFTGDVEFEKTPIIPDPEIYIGTIESNDLIID